MRLLVCLGALALCITAAPACDKKKDAPKAGEAKKDDKKADDKKADEAKPAEGDEKKADEAKPAEGDEKKAEEAPAAEGDEKAEEAPAAEGDEKAEGEAAPAAEGEKKEEAAGIPESCAKMKACIEAMAAANPQAKAALDQSWKAIDMALKGPGAAAVENSCKQALAGYSKAPNAPDACK